MYPSTLSTSLFILTATLGFPTSATPLEAAPEDASSQCSCYLTSGLEPAYFQHYQFSDFRSIPCDGNNDYTSNPELVDESENNGDEAVTSSFFDSTAWTDAWAIMSWAKEIGPNSPIRSVNSPRNVFISRNTTSPEQSTYLTLRASRQESFASISEIVFRDENVKHASMRARLRLLPTTVFQASATSAERSVESGTCFGMFTYQSDTQETDMEILTGDPVDHIHCTNQPSRNWDTDEEIPDATTDLVVANGGRDWTQWHDYRIDWLDGITHWYVDGELVVSKTVNVPTEPSSMLVNLWSDGGVWSGELQVGSQVQVGVEWIEMVYNVSQRLDTRTVGKQHHARKMSWLSRSTHQMSKRAAEGCVNSCAVDGTGTVGQPQLVSTSTGNNAVGVSGANHGIVLASLIFCRVALLYKIG